MSSETKKVRIVPYQRYDEKLEQMLSELITIPMNQRAYEWKPDEQIKQLVIDIFETFKEEKYVFRGGDFIAYTKNIEKQLFDGQQRFITIWLMLIVISQLDSNVYDELIPKIVLSKGDIERGKLSKFQKELIEKYKEIKNPKIPKLTCINYYDREAMFLILNNQFKMFSIYIKNIKDFEDDDGYLIYEENETYCCSICSHISKKKSNFIKHIADKHKYNKLLNSNIYNGYEFIYNMINYNNYTQDQLYDLFYFIIKDINIQLITSSDEIYISRIFEYENNRGKNVSYPDIVKNQILAHITPENQVKIYNEWQKLTELQNSVYKEFGKKIKEVAIQSYNNNITKTINYIDQFKSIIDHNNTHNNTFNNVIKYFKITEDMLKLYEDIRKDRYGRLLTNTPRISFQWELYKYILLPIFYTKKSIDNKLIFLFVKFYFRNFQSKTKKLNTNYYMEDLIKIVNNFLQDTNYDYYSEIKKILQSKKEEDISSKNFINNIKDYKYPNTFASYTLLFIETCESTYEYTPSMTLTAEHIIPKDSEDNLKDKKNINKIGNLTLLEGKNTDGVQKGNFSLKNKNYKNKIDSYKSSCSILTRNLIEQYPNDFTEKMLEKRNLNLVEKLNKYTDY